MNKISVMVVMFFAAPVHLILGGIFIGGEIARYALLPELDITQGWLFSAVNIFIGLYYYYRIWQALMLIRVSDLENDNGP